MTHVKQKMRFPILHSILYAIGSPYLLFAILMWFTPLVLWQQIFFTVFFGILSFTGFIFGHARALIEYPAYINGKLFTQFCGVSMQNQERHFKHCFGSLLYLKMFGVFESWAIKKAMKTNY